MAGIVREQQALQKILPQIRQWCLLTMMLNFVPHSEHSLQALSGIQYLFRSCLESFWGEGRVREGKRREEWEGGREGGREKGRVIESRRKRGGGGKKGRNNGRRMEYGERKTSGKSERERNEERWIAIQCAELDIRKCCTNTQYIIIVHTEWFSTPSST